MRLDALRTGLAFGSVVAAAHALWAAIVGLGWAQPLLDFILWLHFLNIPVQIAPFDWLRASLLVAVTFMLSFAMGAGFALVWNRLHAEDARLSLKAVG